MSLILEALKKAERQHKLGEVPGIGAQPANTAPIGLRGLGWVMLVLLACVMLGLGLYLGGFRLTVQESDRRVRPSPEVLQPPVAPWPAPQTVAPDSAVQPPLPQSAAASPAEARPRVGGPPPMPVFEPVPRVEAPPPLPVIEPAPPARPLSEMPSGYVANLPSLNIDIHSYDSKPAKRYVLINMEKYREGDYLAEGPQLIEIQTDGVVLEHLGERFILAIGN
jgi:general secretion pathway protein B